MCEYEYLNVNSFFINLGVVYYDEARGSDRCKKEDFATVDGIGETMAFQEYSEQYLHLTDTIGINGRPAGKGFYFNAQVGRCSLLHLQHFIRVDTV